jgi:phosphoribosylanthranilate isomerase
MSPAIKICGITRRSDAEAVARSGAMYVGAILAPGGKRSVSPAVAAALFADLPLGRVGVFVDADVDTLREQAEGAALDVLQLHGDETPALVRDIRAWGAWRVWKAVRVRTPDLLDRAIDDYAAHVDGILLDGWSPDAHGGTGAVFDWEALARHGARLPPTVRLIVAGGLNAANVGRAIELLRPSVVDVSSGVETSPGVKDPPAVSEFVAAVRRAGQGMGTNSNRSSA